MTTITLQRTIENRQEHRLQRQQRLQRDRELRQQTLERRRRERELYNSLHPLDRYSLNPELCEGFSGSDLKFIVDDRDKHTDRLIGTEIEVETKSVGVDNTLLVVNDFLGGLFWGTPDGSLTDNGFEIVTTPQSLQCYLNMRYSVLLETLSNMGVESNSHNDDCGIHIHCSRNHIDDSVLKRLKQFFMCNRDWIFQRSNKSRGGFESWSPIPNSLSSWEWRDKYVCINTKHDATIEFRIFGGTLNPFQWQRNILLVDSLVEYFQNEDSTDLNSFVDFEQKHIISVLDRRIEK